MTIEERAEALLKELLSDGEIWDGMAADAWRDCASCIASTIRAAVAEEREACAKVAEETHARLDAEFSLEGCTSTGLDAAVAIRARTP